MMSAIQINGADFEKQIQQGVSLIDFFAAWCGPCKMLAPLIDDLADELDGKVFVGKLDVDENRETAEKHGVSFMPTLLIFKDGEEVNRFVGLQSKSTLQDAINSALDA